MGRHPAPLGAEQLHRITAMLLAETGQRLGAQGVTLRPEHGARPLRREVERRLSRLLLSGELRPGATVHLTVSGDELRIRPGE